MDYNLYSLKQTKTSFITYDNEVHIFTIDEEITLNQESIKFTKTIYPFVSLVNKDMKPVVEVNEYLKSKLSRGQEVNTALSKGYDLKRFYLFLESVNLNFADVKPRHINEFIAYLMYPDKKGDLILNATSKRSGGTINHIISTIRDFYKFLNYFHGIENPFENESIYIKMPKDAKEGLFAHIGKGHITKSIFKVKQDSKEIKILTHAEYETILKYFIRERDALIFKFMFFTGARIGETLSLKIQNIKTLNASKKVQTIELSKSLDNEHIRRRQKTGTRKLYIPNKLFYELGDYYDGKWSDIWDEVEFEHDYFFIGEGHGNYGKPLSYSGVYKTFKQIANDTGIDFTPHDLRHTFATNLARNKVDVSVIQKLLGHKNPSTCSIYIQLAKEQDIAKELEKIFDANEYGVEHEL